MGLRLLRAPLSFREGSQLIATNRLISTPTVELPAPRAASLRRWNIGLGLVHAVQAIAVLALAAFALPVTATFMEAARHFGRRADHPVRRLRGGASALSSSCPGRLHWLVVLPGRRHASVSRRSTTTFAGPSTRFSSSVMIVLIAMLTGISDVAALIGIFAANVAMIFFGAVQERYERPGGSLWPFWLGCVVGIAPWLAVGVYLWSPGSTAEPPAFVYAIFASLFVFFIFAQHVAPVPAGQSVEVVPLRERAYFMLSLVAKSPLAGRCSRGHWPVDSLGRFSHLSHEAADLLGVHYMTIYRRVRLGILPARKIGGTWMVDPADLVQATNASDRGAAARR